MRILNRPMFKYGGPIKEGVMHGMRNGGRIGFKDGPKKKIFGVEIPGTGMAYDPATNQPYDPKYIQEMLKKQRDKMTNVMSWMLPGMRAIKGAGWSYKAGAPAIKKLFQGPVSKSKDLTKYTGPVTPGSDKWFGNIFRPAYQGIKESVKGAVAPLKEFKTSIGLGTLGGSYGLAKGYEAWKKRQAGIDTPDDGTDTTLDTTSRWDDTAPIITDSMREKIAKDAQNKRLKSYLDMMGYDRSKKTALSDALIDASALVQDATTEAGSLKEANWGKLINKAIQTTSKRLDKPEQIREAVGLMSVKAAIEKDMSAEENKLAKELTAKRIEKLDKELKGNTFTQNKVLTAKTIPGQPGFDTAVELTEGKDFKGNLVTSTDWIDNLEDMKDDPTSKGLNEKQLIEKYTNKLIEGKGYEDGHYTVGDNLVTIKDSLVIDVE